MNQQERIEYLISLLKKINPETKIDELFKIKGTTIAKLCEFHGGGYLRVKDWAEKQVSQISAKNEYLEFKGFLDKAFQLMQERNQKYGDSWKVLNVKSIANLIEMKMNRIAQLGADAKTEDELIDTINYACFALIKLKNNQK